MDGNQYRLPASRQAKCWMAESFPLSMEQLLPILDVVGYANKHLKRVRTRPHFPAAHTLKRKHETQPAAAVESPFVLLEDVRGFTVREL